MSWVPRSNKRQSLPPAKYQEGIEESDLMDVDPGINSLVQTVDTADQDDFDWVGSVVGRPAPYSTTWNLVYSSRKPNASGGFDVPCQEKGDGIIKLNGKFQEINASSTPNGAPRKPPVCHVIPWVLLSVALDEYGQKANKTLKADFRRFVCWGDVSNLRTGHNGCNAGGAKVTVSTATTSGKLGAASFVAKCATSYSALYGTPFEL